MHKHAVIVGILWSRKNLDAYCNKAIFVIVTLIYVSTKLIYSMVKRAIFQNGRKNL